MFDKQMMQRGWPKRPPMHGALLHAQDWTVDVALAHSGRQVLSAAEIDMLSANKIPDETIALLGVV